MGLLGFVSAASALMFDPGEHDALLGRVAVVAVVALPVFAVMAKMGIELA